jgi:O-methyltransferase
MSSFRKTVKRWLPPVLADQLRRSRNRGVREQRLSLPDADLYKPLFSPWLGLEPFAGIFEKARGVSLVSADRCWVLYTLAKQAMSLPGEIWETGVYRGGTAVLLREVVAHSGMRKSMRLFDTFEGMPETDPGRDLHNRGDFSDTSLEAVRAIVGSEPWISYHKGYVPATFQGLEAEKIALAHVDVDIYRSILDSCEFIYPRLLQGGFMIFDDYGFASCPGARQAVDEFFADKPECPLVLPTGQAVVFKSPDVALG